jgi:hypothetical protein
MNTNIDLGSNLRRVDTLAIDLGNDFHRRTAHMKTNPFTWSPGPAVPRHASEQSALEWQRLIDTGDVWTLPRWFGRTAAALIAAGICNPPIEETPCPSSI